jgi:hypothetical protein
VNNSRTGHKKADDFTIYFEVIFWLPKPMLQTATIGLTMIALSIIPLLFLLYTITHLDQLGIGMKHPRVIVELLIFIGLLVIGLILWLGLPIA